MGSPAARRRDREVERARPELWRVLRGLAICPRIRRVCARSSSRRAAAPRGERRRLLSADLSRGGAQDAQVLRSLPLGPCPVQSGPRVLAPARGRAAQRRHAQRAAISNRSVSCSASMTAWRISTICSKMRSAKVSLGDELSYVFLRAVENTQSFERFRSSPCFTRCATRRASASRWSASACALEFPDTDWSPGHAVVHRRDDLSVDVSTTTGSCGRCARSPSFSPMRSAGRASYDRARLARNGVPSAAVVYAEDMYVPRALSEETAARYRGNESLAHQRVRAQRAARERSGFRAADGADARRRLAAARFDESRRCRSIHRRRADCPPALSGLSPARRRQAHRTPARRPVASQRMRRGPCAARPSARSPGT